MIWSLVASESGWVQPKGNRNAGEAADGSAHVLDGLRIDQVSLLPRLLGWIAHHHFKPK
jgi:hypothetical protein